MTAILDSQAIEKALLNMQRGSNEAAVTELRTKASGTLPIRVVVNALGQMLYRIGTQAEYLLRQWPPRLPRLFFTFSPA